MIDFDQVKDACKRDVNTVGLSAVESINRALCRKITNSHTGNPSIPTSKGKARDEEEDGV